MRRWLKIAAIITALLLLVQIIFAQSYGYVTINGDVNGDGQICLDDPVQIIYHLWRDGRELPCPDAADVDRSGIIDVNDVVGSLRHIFMGDDIPDCPVSCR